MYQLVKARSRADRRAGRWVDVDLSNAPIATLTTVYGEVGLYITYQGLTEPKALRFDTVSNWVNDPAVTPATTVQGWLDLLGNKTLPFAAELPDTTPKLVRYAQGWHCGYSFEPRERYGAVGTNNSVHAKQDLIATHDKLDPLYINKYALFTVNGYFHLSDATAAGVRIIDGNTTVRRGNNNQIGVYSFAEIGEIRKVPITAEMVKPQQPEGSKLSDGCYITIPETVDLENNTVLLGLGGYLQVRNKTYVRTGDRTWKIELSNIMYLDRYIQSRKDMDLSSMGLQNDELNPSLMGVNQLFGDTATLAYMTLSQSFFVIVDAPSFFEDFQPLEWCGFPGRYLGYKAEQLPVIGAYGRMLDYHTIKEEQTWVYCCTENWRYNYHAHTRAWQKFTSVDGGRYPAHPKSHAAAFQRILGVEN